MVTATATHEVRRTGNGQPTIDAQQRKAERWLALREQAKRFYDEADRLEAELIDLIAARGLTLDDGRTVLVSDNFLDRHGQVKSKAFGICGVKRFELKVK